MSDTLENTQDHAPPAADAHQASSAPSYDDLNTPMIALVGFLSAIVTFICIIGLQAAYLQYSTTHEAEKRDVRLGAVESILSAQEAKLNNGYGWVNKETKTISMPIGQAMKVVAEKYESN
ncbi:hypothetical protein [Blastopirellula marina]|uniref:Uncharacterized protein n=1 Tax=Blastopirellula marina TaxID=124 RepID=A0A2S8G1V0_9BACT|nr:hypothetical protein [Blastopirellula marina]PQO38422.1 hypothetical protein C5Y98_10180 [Blastopirellula marina]PTL45079.1 hypothetical protein C5Y97_10190 [Blastopirellula marina]